MVLTTTDGGSAWRTRNITAMSSPGVRQWVPGPGSGVVLRGTGRIVVPGYYHAGTVFNGTEYGSTVLLTDNGGLTWRQGGSVRPRNASTNRVPGCTYLEPNEAAVAELTTTGAMLLEMRNRYPQAACNRRLTSFSTNQGETFAAPVESTVPQPNMCHGATAACGCEGSLVGMPSSGSGGQQQQQQQHLFFSAPSSTKTRTNGTVWSSSNGRVWEAVWLADRHNPDTPFGYSALALLTQPSRQPQHTAVLTGHGATHAVGGGTRRQASLGLLFSTHSARSNSSHHPVMRFVQIPV